MKEELKILVLSALMHDVGKFAQRANRPYTKEMEERITADRENSGYWHTAFTDYFIRNRKDFPLPEELEESRSLIATTASAHHQPEENMLEMAVFVANRLSSGLNRDSIKDQEPKTGFQENRLLSVFDKISLLNHHYPTFNLEVQQKGKLLRVEF